MKVTIYILIFFSIFGVRNISNYNDDFKKYYESRDRRAVASTVSSHSHVECFAATYPALLKIKNNVMRNIPHLPDNDPLSKSLKAFDEQWAVFEEFKKIYSISERSKIRKGFIRMSKNKQTL